MSKKTFYITTPIYYPSGNAHIGHAYSTVAADVIARFKRLVGFDVVFLTGMDEHGQKIELTAKDKKVTPQELVDNISSKFEKLWKILNISNDQFIRTTSNFHKKAVKKIFTLLKSKQKIYKGFYKGWYCTPCEAFWTETQLDENYKCPDCKRDVKLTKDEAYFFKLSEYSDKILQLYEKNKNFIKPASRLNEMINFVENGLEDLCISRTSFSWGIKVPNDEKHVIYVWLDALTNYITALGYMSDNNRKFESYWPADLHIVGKEIVRFHAVIWPAILMALDLPLPKKIFGHGWWLTKDSSKMSKSKGDVIDPAYLCKKYSVDAVRYFLLRQVPFGTDGTFSFEAFFKRLNSDLANDLGNLVFRLISMIERYFQGKLPEQKEAEEKDKILIHSLVSAHKKVAYNIERLSFSLALKEIFKLVTACNKYIDDTAPWKLLENKNKNIRLATILYNLCESLRIISLLLYPFMPDTSCKIRKQLTIDKTINWEDAKRFGLFKASIPITKQEVIFPRIYLEKEKL
ncbi:MAG: methionine--tRNA ligase [Oscillospiraceae bacterium]|nr:methionine--tRNA ligase [Oscillospiraceae bacterium]